MWGLSCQGVELFDWHVGCTPVGEPVGWQCWRRQLLEQTRE